MPHYLSSVAVGGEALPRISKVTSLMRDKAIEWTSNNELPVDIPLPDDAKYHSVFSCPISKEPASNTTRASHNPPMMMPCGHVISKDALSRLAKGGNASARLKCPYCPAETTLSQAIRVVL
jgi:E3 ubiquitin-protein transferase RMND5